MSDEAREKGIWRCVSCANEYSRAGIELSLVQIVQRQCTVYQLQDQECAKCRASKIATMVDFCGCAGAWANRTSEADIKASLQSFMQIARFHRFPWLLETVESMLGLPNSALAAMVKQVA
jgi:DNA polymerase epsilon subunit 1